MESLSNHRIDARAALEELLKNIRNSGRENRSSVSPATSPPAGSRSRVEYRHTCGKRAQDGGSDDFRQQREILERRAAQLDRMEEILRKMLRAVERREDRVRERERGCSAPRFDEETKIEILLREQALRDAEERLAERERLIEEMEAILLEKAHEIAGSK